jgi:hypothetical protein
MKIIEDAGLVVRKKRGRWVHYGIADADDSTLKTLVSWVRQQGSPEQVVMDDLSRLKSLSECE